MFYLDFIYFYIVKPVAATCIVLLSLCPFISSGQGENNIWCFGNGVAMNFNFGPPVIASSSIYTVEGCGTVCDASGHLLFYASPNAVWDRSNNIMPNGNGLLGNVSSTQGVAIIQSFSDPDQYYVFTMLDVHPYHPGYQSLYYSLIDMSLNAGYGDIVAGQKNIPLDTNVMEKMTVVKGSGCFNWLVVHHQSAPVFHAFKVDNNGVDATPVISTSGFSYTENGYAQGEMKASPDNGSIILVCGNPPYARELHSFNNTTGIVNNAITLDTIWGTNWYGVSYSPDGSKLYIGKCAGTGYLYQYDMSLLPDIVAVRNSRTVISNIHCYGTRLGPDNKLYLIDEGHISVINNPNLSGPACGFVANIFATTGYYDFGNAFIPSLLASITTYTHDTTACLHLDTVTITAPANYNTYVWSDGNTAQADTVTTPGTKWVISEQFCTIRTDTFHIAGMSFTSSSSAVDTGVCLLDAPVISAPGGYTLYNWSDGFAGPQDSFSAAGTKWVTAVNVNTCSSLIDTFHVHDWRDTTKMVLDTTHCVAYTPIPVVAPGGYTSYLWSDGKTTQADTFFNTTTKWVTALNGCNMLIDTVHFTATTIPQDSLFEHNTDTMICFEAGSITVNAPGGYTYYLWSDGITTQGDVFNSATTKWVYAQKLCYLLIDTFSVLSKPTDTLMGRVDTMICFSSGTTLSAVQGYDTYLWSDGNAGITDTFSQTSVKRVNAHRACEERIDTLHVQFINDLSVDLGMDTAICKGEALTLNATSTYNIAKYLWQDGKTSPTYTVTEGGDYSVQVSVGPCNVSDTVRVHQKVIDIKLKDAEIPCHEESVTLDAGVDNASYLWQDGSRNRTYKATKEGSYSVKVTQDNCSASASVTVRFEGCPCNVVIPTAFSPNNDGRNDKFGLTVSCAISSFKLMVYNRWGNQVFYSEDVNQKWDGTCKGIAVDGDVFNYYLEFKDGDNKTYNYKGNVTLVR